jgi:hypothetical protein
MTAKISTSKILLSGFGVGVLTSAIATLITKKPFDAFQMHAMIVGFIYVAAAGCWIGSVQGSAKRTIFGAVSGALIGLTYALSIRFTLPNYPNVSGLLVYFALLPCVLSGLLAGVLGSSRANGLKEFPVCFSKGLISGFMMGIVHFVTLVLLLLPSSCIIKLFGPLGETGTIQLACALGVASALYFFMLQWSVALRSSGKQSGWLGNLSISRVGFLLFIGMTLAGIGWSIMPPFFR